MEFCSAHSQHVKEIDDNAKGVSENAVGISALQAKDSTVKWGIGIFLTLFIFTAGTTITIIGSKMDAIAGELKSIKDSVNLIALDQRTVQTEIINIKERVSALEDK